MRTISYIGIGKTSNSRDLKLENTLVGLDGHIKLADYGICKLYKGYGDFTQTYVGTPDYMAPEILAHEHYGRSVDWWAFGILIYVMLTGSYPFNFSGNARDLLLQIKRMGRSYPQSIGPITKALLNAVPFLFLS